MNHKKKIIELVKTYRAASEKRWSPVHGYKNERERGESDVYDRCANDLEELVRQLTSKCSGREYNCFCSAVKRIGLGKFCPDCGGRNSRR